MKKGELYSFKVYNKKIPYLGIVQSIGEEWILLYNVLTDYMMDSYLLLKREYIESVTRNDKVKFKEEVLCAKGVNFILPALNIPLDDTEQLLKWIEENKVVMMFSLKNEFVGYVGQINKMSQKSFYLRLLDNSGCWWKQPRLYRIKTIRVIEFDTDYIKSLLAYNLKKWPNLQNNES